MNNRMGATLLLTPGWMPYTASVLSVVFGFSLRLAMEFRSGVVIAKTIFTQAAITSCTAYLAFILKRDYRINISIELLLFLTSFFAVFVVSTADEAFKLGFKNYLRILLRKFLVDTDEKKEDQQ